MAKHVGCSRYAVSTNQNGSNKELVNQCQGVTSAQDSIMYMNSEGMQSSRHWSEWLLSTARKGLQWALDLDHGAMKGDGLV